MDTSKSNLPFVVKSDYIEVTKAPSTDKFEVSFPTVDLKEGYSLGKLLGSIDVTKLPFLNKFSIPVNGGDVPLADVVNILKSLDEYWARASVALNGITDASGEMNFDKLQTFFDSCKTFS